MMLRSLLGRFGRSPRGASGPGGTPGSVPLVLITRDDCPLCDRMKAEIARLDPGLPFTVREVDVLSDPELVLRFGNSIPVLEIAGRVAFEGRLEFTDLKRELQRARATSEELGA